MNEKTPSQKRQIWGLLIVSVLMMIFLLCMQGSGVYSESCLTLLLVFSGLGAVFAFILIVINRDSCL